MAETKLSLCILCHDRPDEVKLAIASAADFDEIVVRDMASDPPLAPVPGVEWSRSGTNTGVAAGRNELASRATGDILVFLDDDATFAVPAAAAIRAAFTHHDQPVALAFRVIRPDGHVDSSEFPFRGAPRTLSHTPCGYFVGCGFAVRADAYSDAGGFDDRYVYSTEEVDLAFALQRDGGAVVYEPAVVVRHAPSSLGRAPAPHIPALRLRNRLLLVRRHLPWPVAIVHVCAWSARTLREAIAVHGLRDWLRAWRDGIRMPVDRRPLGWRRLRVIQARGGRVWW